MTHTNMPHTEQNVKKDIQDKHSFFYTLLSIRKSIPPSEKEKIRLLIKKNFECIQKLIRTDRHRTESKRDYGYRIKEYKSISRNLTLNIWAVQAAGKMLNLPMHNDFLCSSSFPHKYKCYKDIVAAYIKADIICLEKKGFRFVTPEGIRNKSDGYLPSKTFFTNITSIWRDEMTLPNYARYAVVPSYPKNWEPIIVVNKSGEKVYRSQRSLRDTVNAQKRRAAKKGTQTWAFDFDKIAPTYKIVRKWNRLAENTLISFEVRGDVLRKLTYDQVETLASLYAQGRIISFSELPPWLIEKYERIHDGVLKKIKIRKKIKKIIEKRREEKLGQELGQELGQDREILNVIRDMKVNPYIPHVTQPVRYSSGTDVPVEPRLGCPSTPIRAQTAPRPLSGRFSDYLSDIVRHFPADSEKSVNLCSEKIRERKLATVCNLWKNYQRQDSVFYVVPTRLVRIFNETVENGGRFYRSTIQSLPAEVRLRLKFNGHNICECDYTAIHPNILYKIIGAEPLDNPYVYDKREPLKRREAKLALLILINSSDQYNAIQALRYSFVKDLGYKKGDPRLKNDYILNLFDTLRDHNNQISKFFCTGVGIKLMRLDSDMALNILDYFVKRNILVVPIHDSFIICDKYHVEDTVCVMKQTFKDIMNTSWDIPISINVAE